MKKKTLWIIIAIILVVVIATGVIIALILHKNNEEANKSVGSVWGDSYYAYLKDAINEEENKEKYGLQDNMKNTKIQFVQTSEENPTMVMSYDKDENEYINIYKIDNENKVEKILSQGQATIEFLYNIEQQSYDWYIHSENETEDIFKKVENVLDDSEDITIKKDDITTQETVSGDTITLKKYDEIFVKPEIEENAQIDFSEDMEIKELKNKIETVIKEYKLKDEIVTENIKAETESKIQETENIKQKIETAKEEVKAEEEKKKEEAAAKKKAEEEAKKAAEGLKVGNYTLKYGKYTGYSFEQGTDKEPGTATYTINSDGTYSYSSSFGSKESGTYKVTYLNTLDSYYGNKYILEFSNGGMLAVPADNTLEELAGAGSRYTYKGK